MLCKLLSRSVVRRTGIACSKQDRSSCLRFLARLINLVGHLWTNLVNLWTFSDRSVTLKLSYNLLFWAIKLLFCSFFWPSRLFLSGICLICFSKSTERADWCLLWGALGFVSPWQGNSSVENGLSLITSIPSSSLKSKTYCSWYPSYLTLDVNEFYFLSLFFYCDRL